MLRNAARPGVQRGPPTRDATSYVAKGQGLTLAAPKAHASFTVSSSTGAKLRMPDLKVTMKGAAKVDFEVKERRDGSLAVKYISHMSGDVVITLAYGRTNVSGSPFKVKCQPPKADPENSNVVLINEHAFIDDEVKARVTTFDQFGEACSAEGSLAAQVLDAQTESVLFDAHLVEVGQGSYEASFVPSVAGLYALNATIGSVAVKGCPLRIKVLADESLAKNCRCFGAGMTQAIAGDATKFTIQAVDGRGVARKSGGDVFEVTISGPNGDHPHATIRDNGEGTYVVSWAGKNAGIYSVRVELDAGSVAGTPFNCHVSPTVIDAAMCEVQANSASNVRAGQRAEFRILARDRFGNLRTQGGDDFAVLLRMVEGPGKTEVEAGVTEEAKGQYKASFVVKHTGIFMVYVTCEGQPVKGSPFKCAVGSGKPDFSKCKLGGPGLTAVRLGQPCDVMVELYDVYSNRITSALDALSDIQVTVDGPSRTSVNPAGMKKGAAVFQYVAMQPGVYTIAATVDGRHITNSPATVTASIAKPFAANCEVLTDTKALQVVAGEELQLLFVAKDKQGIRKSVGGDLFNVQWRLLTDRITTQSVARVTDLSTGEYMALFKDTAAGSYQVSVLYEDKHIAGSPLTLTVRPAALEPSETTAKGSGLQECVAHRQSLLQVLARDRYGNPVPDTLKVGNGELEAVLRGPEEVQLLPVRQEVGCLTLAYTTMKAGVYDLSITYGGRHIASSPWRVTTMPGPAVAAMCSVEAVPSSVVAGQRFSFSLQTRDECRNTTVATNSVTCEVDSPADSIVPLVVSEAGNGVYNVSGSLKGAAVALLRLLVNGAQVQRTPELTVVPGPAATVAWVNTSLHTSGMQVSAGEEAFVELWCQDLYGNRVTSAAEGVNAVLRSEGGQSDAKPCRVAPQSDGLVRCYFRLEKAGHYSLSASLPSSTQSHSPSLTLTVTCIAAEMSITASKIEHGDKQILAGRSGNINIGCYDLYGNPTCVMPDVPITLVPSGGLKVWWRRAAKSTQLQITFTCQETGKFSLVITGPAGGVPLHGSPYEVQVLPDVPAAPRTIAAARSHQRTISVETSTLTAGEPLEVDLQLSDVFGNRVADADACSLIGVSACTVDGPAVPLAPVDVSASLTTLSFSALMTRAGLYTVQVSIAGTMLPRYQLPISVKPADAFAEKCSIRVPSSTGGVGGSGAVVGQPLSCIIVTCDRYGNMRHTGGTDVSPVVIRPDGEESSKAKVKDLTDGRYLLSFTPDGPGEYIVSALINGEEIPASQELQAVVAEPPLAPSQCAMYVAEEARTVAAGSSFYVTVGPPESQGAVLKDDTRCLVHLMDPENRVTLFPAEWDAAQVAFVADVFVGIVGGNCLWSTIDGVRVGGAESKVLVQVEPNCIELNASDLNGRGLKACVAGETAEVMLIARDALGNANASLASAQAGVMALQLQVQESDGTKSVVKFTPDGSKAGGHKASYKAKHAGPVQLTVQLLEADGSIIQERSVDVQCQPGKPSPRNFELVWTPKPVTAGVPVDMHVVCKDEHGNLIQELLGLESWNVLLQKDNSQVGSVEIQPLPNSRYGFSFMCPVAGTATATFSFSGVMLFEAPVPLTVLPGAVDVRSCVAKFIAKRPAFVAGNPISIGIQLQDSLGNAVPHQESHEVQVYLAPGKSESVLLNNKTAGWKMFDLNGDVATLSVDKAGSYVVHVTAAGQPLTGWPRVITVDSGTCSAAQSSVTLHDNGARQLRCRERSLLTLVTRDRFGNTCTKGGARVEVAARAVGSVQPGHVVDNKDGTYLLALELDVEGPWEVTVTAGGAAVAGTPLRVQAAYDLLTAAQCEVVGVDTAVPLIAGSMTPITIQAKDVDKTRRGFSGSEAISLMSVNAVGHEQPLPVAMDNGGLRAVAALTPVVPGPLKVTVTIGGEALPLTPLNFTVSSGKISGRHCSLMPVTVDTAARSTVELPSNALFVVNGGDALNNQSSIDEDDVEVTLRPPQAVTDVHVQTAADGSIVICGVVNAEAEAMVSVKGAKVNQMPLRLVPKLADGAQLRVAHAPDAPVDAGSDISVVLQVVNAAGVLLETPDLSMSAELSLKSDRRRPSLHQPNDTDSRTPAAPREGQGSLRTSEHGFPMDLEEEVVSVLADSRTTTTPPSAGRSDCTIGLPMVPTFAANVAAALRSLPVSVAEVGPSMFRVTAVAEVAGSYSLRVGLGSADGEVATLLVPVEVRSAPFSPENSLVVTEERSCARWVAGGTARLIVRVLDRFQNPVNDVDSSQLDITCSGPGAVQHSLVYGSRGKCTVVVRLTARKAGRYEVNVRDRLSGKPLGGSSTVLNCLPGDLNPRMSVFHVQGWKVTGERPVVHAGMPLHLALAVFDVYGNPGMVKEENISAFASGKGGVVRGKPVRRVNTRSDEAKQDVQVQLALTTAGVYSLAVEIMGNGGKVVRLASYQGHDAVAVQPGPADPMKTIVEGWPGDSTPLETGSVHNLTIVPCDAFGNRGGTGAAFLARLRYSTTGETTAVPVTPVATGSTSLTAAIVPKTIGSPTLEVVCSPSPTVAAAGKDTGLAGDAEDAAAAASAAAGDEQGGEARGAVDGSFVVASKGLRVVAAGTSAEHCLLSDVFPAQGAVVGMAAGMLITAMDTHGNRRYQGGDRFTVDIPGLPQHAVRLTDRRDGTYTIEFTPANEGSASVHVMLDGAHVRGSPMAMSVHRDVDALARGALSGKLSAAVKGLRRGLTSTRNMQNNLRAETEALRSFVPVLVQSVAADLGKLLSEQQYMLKDAREAVQREGIERRRLHNLVQELRGNIRVYVRVKPLGSDELEAGVRSSLTVSTDRTRIECNTGQSTKAFDFDRVFNSQSTQEEVFAEVSGLVTSALDGYNVCVFAYGQTGSGKTYTMEGPQDNPGISFRTMKELFRVIDTERRASHTHAINVSIVEIYNEQVRDLLSGETTDMELQKTSTGFSVPGLKKVNVTTAEQVLDVMAQGYEYRCVAAHDINAHSSRSHALLVVEVAATDLASGIRSVGKLTLCDLAGSERVNKTGASGMTLVEAQNINKSLLELGNVMSALMAQSSYVPYRNSKLTMLLQDSLGGDAKALMFCNLAPQPLHVSETLSSLAFASKVSSVVLKTPMRRVEEAKEDDDSADKLQTRAANGRKTNR